ncbi:MAG: C39 family peptidase [Caldilineaceae bacterium]
MPGRNAPIQLNVPHLQQPRAGDCLPACAYMVLHYLNRPILYWRLRRILGTQDFGTPFLRIRTLERLRLTVEVATHGTVALLREYLMHDQPVIVSIQTENLPYWSYNTLHAVVVTGMNETQIYLNDPEFPTAPIETPIGDFELAWLPQDERYAVLIP